MLNATQCLSPHFNQRPNGTVVDLLVIHNISLPPGQFENAYIEAFFKGNLDCSLHPYFEQLRDLKVSAHFLIKRSGQLIQFVDTDHRAWHAGESTWQGRSNCNDFSIGIELEGTDELDYEDNQYQQLAELTARLQQRYPAITTERIVGHIDIAPQRKTDPGASFDWSRFRKLLSEIDVE